MIRLAFDNIVFDDEDDEPIMKAMIAALNWLARAGNQNDSSGEVWLIVAEDRGVHRIREGGRFSNAPDTKQQRDLAESLGADEPVLSMMRQNGTEQDGWRGLPPFGGRSSLCLVMR